jgi:hypothetical protein
MKQFTSFLYYALIVGTTYQIACGPILSSAILTGSVDLTRDPTIHV